MSRKTDSYLKQQYNGTFQAPYGKEARTPRVMKKDILLYLEIRQKHDYSPVTQINQIREAMGLDKNEETKFKFLEIHNNLEKYLLKYSIFWNRKNMSFHEGEIPI